MNKLKCDLLQKDKLIDVFNPLQSHISCSEKFSELPESLEPRSAGKCTFHKPCPTFSALPFRCWLEGKIQGTQTESPEVIHGKYNIQSVLSQILSSCSQAGAHVHLWQRFCWEDAGESQQITLLIPYSKPWNAPTKGGSWYPSKFTNRKCYYGFYIFMLGLIFVSSSHIRLCPAVSFDHIMWSVLIKGAESEQCKTSHYIVSSIYLLL